MQDLSRDKDKGIEGYDYALFKFTVSDSNYYFIHVDELPDNGFSSLYYITASDAEALGKAGFAAFKGTVWSPYLWIDTDTEQGALSTEQQLRTLGLTYFKYDTGNRGAHFRIPRPHEPSHLLPLLDKSWVRTNLPCADLSIYTPLHLFRLAGTLHEETGNRKTLMGGHAGEDLIYNKYSGTDFQDYLKEEQKEATQSIFLNQTIMSATVPYNEGERNSGLTRLAVMLKYAGESEGFIARWLYHTNLLFSNPVQDSEIEKIVEWVRVIE